ncbi:MAG: NAD(P)/FAD-dependent oxidoreductase, partial [Sphingomonas sp.]|nr:NAD(P)/FAD-dependent oxidoreductase [Sphingomonas sp.]
MAETRGFDAIIIGAGAAGMFCAGVAGQRGRKVLLVDHSAEPGRKILISGGGRCNFTNIGAGAANFLSANPHFAKSALGRYTPADFLALVERHGIAWHEKTLGQLFCDGSSRQIVAMLLDECRSGGVEMAFGEPADVEHRDGRFTVTAGRLAASAPALVLATGGLSIPKLGATSFSYDVARR